MITSVDGTDFVEGFTVFNVFTSDKKEKIKHVLRFYDFCHYDRNALRSPDVQWHGTLARPDTRCTCHHRIVSPG